MMRAQGAPGSENIMSGVGVFVAVVIGILAGWVADLVLARRHACSPSS
jgi:hypothetical protein